MDQTGALFDATQEVALGIASYDSFASVIESKLVFLETWLDKSRQKLINLCLRLSEKNDRNE